MVALGTAVMACAVDGEDPECDSGKCDAPGGSFLASLADRSDPIARWLKSPAAGAGPDGRLKASFSTFIKGIAAEQGCPESSWRTFVVSDDLFGGPVFPRLISTVCNDPANASKASEAFVAASFRDETTGDVDARKLEMFAWDATTKTYNFYATQPAGGDVVTVEVEPSRCRDCHLTPTNIPSSGMAMTPIMNELTIPWSHWNSQEPMFNADDLPFRSHEFEVPDSVRDKPNFKELAVARAGAAQRLEQLIRASQGNVANVRAIKRRSPAKWEEAMELLRPLFCEEQLQFTSEDFDSGQLNISALIPGGIREAYRAFRPTDWPWSWFNNQDARVHLASPETERPLFMMPTRGNVDIDYESRLLTGKALTPHQVLRIRALDWKRPVFSQFRCELWTKGRERIAAAPPSFPADAKNVDAMRALFDEIMKVDGRVPLAPNAADQVVALDVASASAVSALGEALAANKVPTDCGAGGAGACSVTLDQFGDMLDQYVTTFTDAEPDAARRALRVIRDVGLCAVKKSVRSLPSLPPDVKCE
jgi:hypothetical protein